MATKRLYVLTSLAIVFSFKVKVLFCISDNQDIIVGERFSLSTVGDFLKSLVVKGVGGEVSHIILLSVHSKSLLNN